MKWKIVLLAAIIAAASGQKLPATAEAGADRAFDRTGVDRTSGDCR